MKPTDPVFWHDKIKKAVEDGKEDYILSVEDYIAGLCIEAYEMGQKDGK